MSTSCCHLEFIFPGTENLPSVCLLSFQCGSRQIPVGICIYHPPEATFKLQNSDTHNTQTSHFVRSTNQTTNQNTSTPTKNIEIRGIFYAENGSCLDFVLHLIASISTKNMKYSSGHWNFVKSIRRLIFSPVDSAFVNSKREFQWNTNDETTLSQNLFGWLEMKLVNKLYVKF